MLAVNTTEPCWSDGVPVTIVDCAGASFPAGWGTLAWHSFWPVQVSVLCALLVGATGPTLADGALSPTEFRATTEHVYGAPLVSPETTRGLPNPPFDLSAPLGEVHDATKAVAGDPPAPASNETVTVPSPAISVPIVGASGAVGGGDVTVSISPSVPQVLVADALLASPL